MRIIAFVLLVFVTLSIGYASWAIWGEVSALYRDADPSVRLAIVTAAGSAVAFIFNNAIQSSRERRNRFFESKREAYSAFFESFLGMMENHEDPNFQNQNLESIKRLRKDIMVWGSPSTISAFNRFMVESAINPSPDVTVLFQRTEDFLRALRKDLGHNDRWLEKFSLTKMVLRGDQHDQLS